MQAHISKHVVLLSCLCLDHNCSLGSQNKICQVILAEGQTDWAEFLPGTMRLTSLESHSDSSLFSTFKHKIRRGFKVGRWKHCCHCLPEISFVLAWRQQRVISHEDSLFDQILWLHADRTSCIDADLPGQGWRNTQADSSSHPQWQRHISSRASPGACRGCGATETHKRSHVCLMDFSADLTNLQSLSSRVHQLQNRSTQMLACLCSACCNSNESGTRFKQRVQINFPS